MKNILLTIPLILVFNLTQTGCSPKNIDDCLLEAAKSPTEQGVNMAALACNKKFKDKEKEIKKEVDKSQTKVTKTREICHVYWDGIKFQTGETEGENWVKYSRTSYGVDVLEISIPRKMVDDFEAKGGESEKYDKKKFMEFLNKHFNQINELCNFN